MEKKQNAEKKILDTLKEDFQPLTAEQENILSGGFSSIDAGKSENLSVSNSSCPPSNTQCGCGNTVAGCHGPTSNAQC